MPEPVEAVETAQVVVHHGIGKAHRARLAASPLESEAREPSLGLAEVEACRVGGAVSPSGSIATAERDAHARE
jgi:hypothetical protein